MNRSALSHQFIAFTRLRQRASVRLVLFWLLAIATCLVVLPSRAQSPSTIDGLSPQSPISPSSAEQLPALPQNVVEFVTPQVNNNQPFGQPRYNYSYEQMQMGVPSSPLYTQAKPQYWVVVNSSEPQLLAAIKQIEPTAYLRTIQGKSLIQAGVFSTPVNADTRARQLVMRGIPAVQVINAQNGQVTAYNPGNSNPGNSNLPNQPKPESSKYYFVAIPARPEELPAIENRIRQSGTQNVNVLRRNQPRGWHVAVGPFRDRSIAEQWNSYVKNLGLSNARVYYGK